MLQTCTCNDLLRYIYRETTHAEEVMLKESLKEDFFLREVFQELYQGYKQLPKALFRPSSTTINNIRAYSKSTRAEKTV
jgi:hypothetical protein